MWEKSVWERVESPLSAAKGKPRCLPQFHMPSWDRSWFCRMTALASTPHNSVPMLLRSRAAAVGRALLSASQQDAQLYSQCLLNELEHVEMIH